MDIPFLADSQGPPWLPQSVVEARKWAYWGQLIFFIFFLVYLVLSIPLLLVGGVGAAGYVLVGAVVDVIVLYVMKTFIFDAIDQGNFKDASDRLLIFGILGLVFGGLIPGILLLIGFLKIQEIFQPQYQQYVNQPYQAQAEQYQAPPQPPQQQAPPAPPAPPKVEAPKKKADMVKCKNCGVRYPSFMKSCPNCGTPK
jgi:hypothetical protein